LEAVATPEALTAAAKACREIQVEDDLARYLAALVRATRQHDAISLGASPRAGIALYRAAQALAALRGRSFVTPDDIKALLAPVLGHRLLLTVDASLRGRAVRQILDEIARSVPVPVEGKIGLPGSGQ
jgi:MoxR-like ATPase